MHRMTELGRSTAARAQVVRAELGGRLTAGLRRRTEILREDGERGAQAAEYAMLGGVSAAACGTLIKVVVDHPDLFETILDTVGSIISSAIQAWF